jgi:hypothetical protein
MSRNYPLIVGLLILAGCATEQILPARYQITVPAASAAPAAVLLRNDNLPGNAYTISFFAMTNTNSGLLENAAYDADLATNRWPVKRCHLDLSLDGGQTWPRRIGYGVACNPDGVGGEFIWSPPEDYNLMTSNAMIRAVSLDSVPFTYTSTNQPYDMKPGTYPTSPLFTIGGATITYPSAGLVTWQGIGLNLAWRQMGAGNVMSVYWLTPDNCGMDVSHWITTISNAVDGANTHYISLNVPVAPQIKLVLVSAADPRILGYSPCFTVDP